MQKYLNELIKLERSLIQIGIRQSPKQLDKVLADNFVEFPSKGEPYTKQDALNNLPKQEPTKFWQQDYQLTMLSEKVALLTYKATVSRESDNKTTYSLRSSIWKNFEGNWKMMFHQGTICEPFTINNNNPL